MDKLTASHSSAKTPLSIGLPALGLTLLWAVWGAITVNYGIPVSTVLRYTAYWILGIAIPGTVVLKAAIGSTKTWLGDIVLGTILGLCLELAAWAFFSLLDLRGWLWLWPLTTAFTLIPRKWRQRILQRPTKPHITWVGFGLTVSVVVMALRLWWPVIVREKLPPSPRFYYVDIPWHLGLINEAKRALPLITPQMVDAGHLKYSWFFHAHLASSSLITGIDVPQLFFRLWYAPFIVLALLAIHVLAVRLTSRPWMGVVSVLLFSSMGAFPFWTSFMGQSNYLPFVSPTMVFSIVISLLCVYLLVEILDGGSFPHWPLLVMSGIVCAGSKSSTMLVLTCAVMGTAVVSLLLKKARRRAFSAVAVFGLLTLFALSLVTGGGDSTKVSLFNSFTLLPPFRALGGRPFFDSAYSPDLFRMSGLGWWLFLTLLVAMSVRFVVSLSVVLVPLSGALRSNLGAWLLGGIVVAGWIPLLVISHRGYSQYYFMYTAMPFASILLAWALSVLIEDTKKARMATALSVAAGAIVSSSLSLLPTPKPSYELGDLQRFLYQVGATVVVLGLLGMVGWVLSSRGKNWLRASWLAVLIGALIVTPFVRAPWGGIDPPQPVTSERAAVPLAEGRAGLWIAANVPQYDVIATNSACSNKFADACDARRWWVSGIGGRRVFLEGWRYTPDGSDGKLDETDVRTINDAAFTAPSSVSIQALKMRGVSWMVVERLPGYPSPDLKAWGTVAYTDDIVTIYRLS